MNRNTTRQSGNGKQQQRTFWSTVSTNPAKNATAKKTKNHKHNQIKRVTAQLEHTELRRKHRRVTFTTDKRTWSSSSRCAAQKQQNSAMKQPLNSIAQANTTRKGRRNMKTKRKRTDYDKQHINMNNNHNNHNKFTYDAAGSAAFPAAFSAWSACFSSHAKSRGNKQQQSNSDTRLWMRKQ